jgi:hypothetical protein
MILADPLLFSITGTPRPNPEANAFKTGTAADCPRVPEDLATISARTINWYPGFRPQNPFHCWLVEQAVVSSLRIDRNDRIERRQRDRVALRAERFWDDDRRLEAEALGEQIAKKPAATLNKLRQTPQGCDWLIARWSALARFADGDKRWSVDQKNLAFSLLGVRADEQSTEPGETIDLEGKAIATAPGSADLAHRQIAELLRRKQDVADVDALDRAAAMSDHGDETTPESKRLRQTNVVLHRRLKWCIDQINVESPYAETTQKAHDYYWEDPVIEKPAEPPIMASDRVAPATPRPDPVPKPRFDPKEFDEHGNTWPHIIKQRLDEKDREQDARDEARYAKRAARYKKQRQRLGA